MAIARERVFTRGLQELSRVLTRRGTVFSRYFKVTLSFNLRFCRLNLK